MLPTYLQIYQNFKVALRKNKQDRFGVFVVSTGMKVGSRVSRTHNFEFLNSKYLQSSYYEVTKRPQRLKRANPRRDYGDFPDGRSFKAHSGMVHVSVRQVFSEGQQGKSAYNPNGSPKLTKITCFYERASISNVAC